MTSLLQKIECPTCGKKNTWTEDNPSRPFCSPRCKLIDLGAWAAEEHRIEGESAEQDIPDADNADEKH